MRRPHRLAHALAWRVLAVLLPAALLAAIVLRQDGPSERPAVRLEAPP